MIEEGCMRFAEVEKLILQMFRKDPAGQEVTEEAAVLERFRKNFADADFGELDEDELMDTYYVSVGWWMTTRTPTPEELKLAVDYGNARSKALGLEELAGQLIDMFAAESGVTSDEFRKQLRGE